MRSRLQVGFWRKLRPDISRAALIGYADNLADADQSPRNRPSRSTARWAGHGDGALNFGQSPGCDWLLGTMSGCSSNVGAYFRRQAAHDGCWCLARRVPARRSWLFICCSTSCATAPP